MTTGSVSIERLAAADAQDRLAPLRCEFALPDGIIYLDGNSLGALPKAASARIAEVITQEWGEGLVRSWTQHDWIGLPQLLGARIAGLIGAGAGQVVVADSTSVNLFKLLAAALHMRPQRRTILSERGNFPTDLYIADGLARFLDRGHRLRLVDADALGAHIDDDTAVVMLTHVDFKSGRMHDMRAMTRRAHDAGAIMLWDLSHSTGVVPVALDGCQADFAVGCGYKYLNGGPGAPAFAYVATRHHEALVSPLAGWMGHAEPFAFAADYRPADGVQRLLCGTPPIISLVALDVGVALVERAGIAAIRAKSISMVDTLMRLVEQECAQFGFTVITPRDAQDRGSQLALRHPDGYPIMQALIDRGVIGDFRAPDVLRFGLAPLYLRYVDLWNAVAVLREVMQTRAWTARHITADAASPKTKLH